MVAKIHAPNFWGFEKFYWDLVKNTPDWMKRPGFALDYAYGCFPGMIWNGGRPQNPDQLDGIQEIVRREIQEYAKLGIQLELTCNNISLLPEDYLDSYCNDILEVWEEYNYTVIVAQQELAEYIKETYPGIKLKRSCVAWEDNKPDFNYDMIVLDQFQGGNNRMLLGIQPEDRSRFELVANIECADTCPSFKAHHKMMSDLQRWGASDVTFQCPLMKQFPLALPMYHSKRNNHYISPEKALELEAWGYQHFKLVSRCYIGQAINSVVDYIIRPDFKDDAIARAYQCFGMPRKVAEPIDYNFLTRGEELDDRTKAFLQIW